VAGQTVQVSVLADTRQFKKAMSGLGDTTGLSKLSSGFKKLGKAVAIGVAAAGAAALVFAKQSVDSAANLEQSFGAVDAVFKGNSKSVHKWAKNAAKDVGLSEDAYNNLAVLMGSQLKNGGASLDELGGKTKNLISTGADLASMFGGTTQEAVEALSSALKGERDPIEKYGVTLKQNSIDAEAAALGFKKVGGSLSAEANQAATLSLIMKQTKDAHGNFAKESDTLQHKQQVLAAQFENVKAKIGKFLIPAVSAVVGWFSDRLGPAADKVSDWFEKTGLPAVKAFGDWLQKNVVPVLKDLGDKFKSDVLPKITAFGTYITGTVIPAIKDLGTWLANNKDVLLSVGVAIATVLAGIKAYQVAMAAWKVVQTAAIAIQGAWNIVMAANPIGIIILAIAGLVAGLTFFFTKTETGKRIWAGFTKALSTGWNAIKGAFSAGYSAVKGFLQKTWDFIKKVWDYSPLGVVTKNWGAITSFIASIPGKVKGSLTNAAEWLKSTGGHVITGLKNGLTGAWHTVTDWLGSLPTKVGGNVKDAGKWLYDIGGQIITGLKNGILSVAGNIGKWIVDKVPGPLKGAVRKALGIHSPSKVFAGYGANIIHGLVNGLNGTASQATAAITRIANKVKDTKNWSSSRGSKSALIKYVEDEGKALTAKLKTHESLVKKIAKANDKLKQMQSDRAALKDSVASAVVGELDLTTAIKKDDDGNIVKGGTTFAAVKSVVSGMLAKVKTFNSKMKALIKAGFPPALVQELAGYGMDSAIELAGALLSGSKKEQKSLISDYSGITTQAKKVGDAIAGQMYDVGINTQKGLIKGLEADDKKITKAAKKLTDKLTKAVKKELGIKSPSRVFRALGGYTIAGLQQGLEATGGLAKTMVKVSNTVANGYDPTLTLSSASAATKGSTGNTYNVTVNAGISNPAETGRAVVSAIKAFERQNGTNR